MVSQLSSNDEGQNEGCHKTGSVEGERERDGSQVYVNMRTCCFINHQ